MRKGNIVAIRDFCPSRGLSVEVEQLKSVEGCREALHVAVDKTFQRPEHRCFKTRYFPENLVDEARQCRTAQHRHDRYGRLLQPGRRRPVDHVHDPS